MPVYLYGPSKKQGNECCNFEIHQSIKDDPIEKCPTCNGEVCKIPSTFMGKVGKKSAAEKKFVHRINTCCK